MAETDYQKFLDRLSEVELQILISYAKNRAMEPFEGMSGLETMQETNLKLTNQLDKFKDWRKTKKHKHLELEDSHKTDKGAWFSQRLKLGKIATGFSKITKQKYKELESVVKEQMIEFLKKGLELIKNENYEAWILGEASRELGKEFKDLEQIKQLCEVERQRLIRSLYPYRSKRYKTLLSSFDKSVSVFLGAIVATNLPGTGILVSLINMAKTIIRMSNRINSLSIIYGYKVENLAGLFDVCANILNVLGDWEKNEQHEPPDPLLLDNLYRISNKNFESELISVVEAVGNKDLYIAIPGIGMLSLGKINLENLEIDILTKNLIRDYFFLQKIKQSPDYDFYMMAIKDYQRIFAEFKNSKYFKLIRKKTSNDASTSKRAKIGSFFRSLVGTETLFVTMIEMLTIDTKTVFKDICNLPEEEKPEVIRKKVEKIVRIL